MLRTKLCLSQELHTYSCMSWKGALDRGNFMSSNFERGVVSCRLVCPPHGWCHFRCVGKDAVLIFNSSLRASTLLCLWL